jgi:hypothetical protein
VPACFYGVSSFFVYIYVYNFLASVFYRMTTLTRDRPRLIDRSASSLASSPDELRCLPYRAMPSPTSIGFLRSISAPPAQPVGHPRSRPHCLTVTYRRVPTAAPNHLSWSSPAAVGTLNPNLIRGPRCHRHH